MTVDAIILAGLLAGLIFLFIVLSGVVKLLERVPGVSAWLDRHVGEEPTWRQW